MFNKLKLYINNPANSRLFLWAALAGIALRLIISLKGNNWDLGSYEIVSSLVLKGKNVYAHTERYNYGPIWCYILALLRLPGFGFPFFLSLFLSLVDVSIAYLFYRRGNFTASLFFIFSPASIIISGFHRQFDNLAILLVFSAVFYAERKLSKSGGENLSVNETLVFSVILGISIITKHIFAFFPLWQFFRIKGTRQKLIVLFIPAAMFLISFLPFLPEGFEGIKQNVFLYSSKDNAPLYYAFFNRLADLVLPQLHLSARQLPKLLFFAAIIISGYLLRKRSLFEGFAFYTICIVLFSSAVACQYLVIPVLFTAVYPNFFSILYNITVFVYFTISFEELDLGQYVTSGFWLKIIEEINFKNSYILFALILLYDFIYVLFGKKIKELFSTNKKISGV
jgi:hypothetical protein